MSAPKHTPTPAPDDKCECGKTYAEHNQGANYKASHATNECPDGSGRAFRPLKEDKQPTDIHSIEWAVRQGLTFPFAAGSLSSEVIKEQLPELSVTASLEKLLQPKYQNDVFTWAQIERALNEDFRLKNKNHE